MGATPAELRPERVKSIRSAPTSINPIRPHSTEAKLPHCVQDLLLVLTGRTARHPLFQFWHTADCPSTASIGLMCMRLIQAAVSPGQPFFSFRNSQLTYS